MQKTTNYELNKIELTDSPADITVINPNWDKIDEKLKSHDDVIPTKRDHTVKVTNANLNTLLGDKTYSCAGTLTNTPIATTFCFVEAFDTDDEVNGNIVQICHIPQSDKTVRSFVRSVSNGTSFGAWRELATTATLNSEVDVLNYLIDENKFLGLSLAKAFNNGLLWLLVELFEDTVDVDTTKGDGASVVANYFDATKHAFIKNDSTSVVIQSKAKVCSKTNNTVWVYCDWEGSGSVTAEVSRNNGSTFTTIPNDTLTSISGQSSGVSMICRLTITGVVTLKNVAWGCK